MLKRIDWKYCFWIVLIIAAAIATYLYKDWLLKEVDDFFTFPDLNLIAGGLSAVITVVYKVKTKKLNIESISSFPAFKDSFESLFSFISNPITLAVSLSFAKGLFLHWYKKIDYFPFFNDTELLFAILITAYFLYISILELVSYVGVIIQKTPIKVELPEPITEEEFEGSSQNKSVRADT